MVISLFWGKDSGGRMFANTTGLLEVNGLDWIRNLKSPRRFADTWNVAQPAAALAHETHEFISNIWEDFVKLSQVV